MWSVVSQKRHHQTLKERQVVLISIKTIKQEAKTLLTGSDHTSLTHHDCPLPVLSLREDEGSG